MPINQISYLPVLHHHRWAIHLFAGAIFGSFIITDILITRVLREITSMLRWLSGVAYKHESPRRKDDKLDIVLVDGPLTWTSIPAPFTTYHVE
jgi:hypothetical protein